MAVLVYPAEVLAELAFQVKQRSNLCVPGGLGLFLPVASGDEKKWEEQEWPGAGKQIFGHDSFLGKGGAMPSPGGFAECKLV